VTLHVGDHLQVVLASTYWRLGAASSPAVLRSDGQPVMTPRSRGCVPGGGCGTEAAAFAAIKTGTSTVSASRTNCGEALRSTKGHGRFVLTVIVK
jgi:hypothetical protein